MSINVFKKHSTNKITFSDRSALCGELKVMGFGVYSLRWYFVSMVPGSVDCRTCCLLYITLVNSLASASSASSSTVLWCCSQRPQRMPRRMTACSRFRSSANVKPHHELAAYTSFATTTESDWLEDDVYWCSCHAVGSEYSQFRRAWTLCEHEEMTLLTCSCTDRELVTVTPINVDSTYVI